MSLLALPCVLLLFLLLCVRMCVGRLCSSSETTDQLRLRSRNFDLSIPSAFNTSILRSSQDSKPAPNLNDMFLDLPWPPIRELISSFLKVQILNPCNTSFCLQFCIQLMSLRSHCHGERKSLTMQLNSWLVRRIELDMNPMFVISLNVTCLTLILRLLTRCVRLSDRHNHCDPYSWCKLWPRKRPYQW